MTKAEDINNSTSKRRQKAADEQPGVSKLDVPKDSPEALYNFLRAKAQEAADLSLNVKALNETRKAIFDAVEAKGVHRQAFRDMLKQLRMKEGDRLKYQKSQRQIAKAHGWDDGLQLDMLTQAPEATERGEAEMTTERLSQIADHIVANGSHAMPEAGSLAN